MKNFLLLFGFVFLLFGCSFSNEVTKLETENKNNEQTVEIDLKKFFKPHKSIATFYGEGNEYATYTEKTFWLNDQYVSTVVDNEAVAIKNIYKINEEKIDLIYTKPIDFLPHTTLPFPEKYDSMPSFETYLTTPIKVGTKFGKWTIVEINTTVQTPFKTFDNAFIIEETGEHYVNRKYIVENFGEVKSEYIMNTDEGDQFIVTSTLQSIKMNE